MPLGQSSSFPKFSATGNWCDSWFLLSSFPWQPQMLAHDKCSRSPLEYGWRYENKYLMPKYFEGPMMFDFLQYPACMCKGKFICSNNCVCVEQNLSFTSMCGCQGNEECRNQLSHQLSLAENLGNDEDLQSTLTLSICSHFSIHTLKVT
jgi:hypothetical protein